MTKSILHPEEKRPVNKATMDQPQEEFVDEQNASGHGTTGERPNDENRSREAQPRKGPASETQ